MVTKRETWGFCVLLLMLITCFSNLYAHASVVNSYTKQQISGDAQEKTLMNASTDESLPTRERDNLVVVSKRGGGGGGRGFSGGFGDGGCGGGFGGGRGGGGGCGGRSGGGKPYYGDGSGSRFPREFLPGVRAGGAVGSAANHHHRNSSRNSAETYNHNKTGFTALIFSISVLLLTSVWF